MNTRPDFTLGLQLEVKNAIRAEANRGTTDANGLPTTEGRRKELRLKEAVILSLLAGEVGPSDLSAIKGMFAELCGETDMDWKRRMQAEGMKDYD